MTSRSLFSMLLLCLLCATSALAQEPQERIAYYTVENSQVTVFFLDAVTRTTTQRSFALDAGETVKSAELENDHVLFTTENAGSWRAQLWSPLDGTLTEVTLFTDRTVSPDGQFTTVSQLDNKTRELTITIQNRRTKASRVVVLPSQFLGQELVWAHHSNVFATLSTQCLQKSTVKSCDESQLLIIDAETGMPVQSIFLPLPVFTGEGGMYHCNFVWAPDDHAIAMLSPCYVSGVAVLPQVYIQTLGKTPSLTVAKLESQEVSYRLSSLISGVSITWFDSTHVIIGSTGRLPSEDLTQSPEFDATTLHTYLYDIETEALTPFLDQYTLGWTEMQPGVFGYEVHSFPFRYGVESQVIHFEIARFDGTTTTVLNNMPGGYGVTINAAGTFVTYIVGTYQDRGKDEVDMIGIVSMQDASFSTYVTPQDNTHFIGWVSTAP